MIEKIKNHFEYVLKFIHKESIMFATVVVSYAMMQLIPMCILGVGMSTIKYFYSFYPDEPENTYAIFLSPEDGTLLDPQQVTKEIPEIKMMSANQNKEINIINDTYFESVVLTGISSEMSKIYNIQQVTGKPLLYKTNDKVDKNFCWVGSTLYSRLVDKENLQIEGHTYHIAGIVHNRQFDTTILIDSALYQARHGDVMTFSLSLAAKDSKNIQDIINRISDQYNLKTAPTYYNWVYLTDIVDNQFAGVVGAITIIFIVVFIYGLVNILTILFNRYEGNKSITRIQSLLGISKKQLFFQEFLYIILVMLFASLLDLLVVFLVKDLIAKYLLIYIEMSAVTIITTILFSMMISFAISYLLFRRQVRFLSR